MRVDIHNHTPYCNHASGYPLLYLDRAAEIGIDVYGFSCHAPMDFDHGYRMGFDQLNSYINLVRSMSSSIELLCGLEVDYIKGREDLLDDRVLGSDVDYLIGSVHFLDSWGFDNPETVFEWIGKDIFKCWTDYLDSIISMARTKCFDIVGHFDLLKIFGNFMPSQLYGKLLMTLEEIAASEMVIEINSAGLRKKVKEQYPSADVLRLAKRLGIGITFGSDAHSVDQVGAGYDVCLEVARSVGYDKVVYFKGRRRIEVDL